MRSLPSSQESELPEDNAPQEPLHVLRLKLHHHRRLADNSREETGAHVQRLCECFEHSALNILAELPLTLLCVLLARRAVS